MKQIYYDLIYLITCSVNNIIPDRERIEKINLDELYELSKYHSVGATINKALEDAGIKDKRFIERYEKTTRNNILFNIEREKVLNEFEKNGIWYMPLKGCLIKDYYPKMGMRQMSDNDILFDMNYRSKVKDIMESLGYKIEEYEESNHDAYCKEPIYYFELHTKLFEESLHKNYHDYYIDMKRIMKKDNNNKYGYHLSDEDFYIYITTHEAKHYKTYGTGIRGLIDCYIILKNKMNKLDWKYIKQELDKLGVTDYEKRRRKLAMKLFSKVKFPKLNEEEIKILEYYMTSGTHGKYSNFVKGKLKNQSKISYILSCVFISRERMNAYLPFTAKSPLLYPLGVVIRFFKLMILNNNYFKETLRTIIKYDKKKI